MNENKLKELQELEDYCSYETSELLNRKGFDYELNTFYKKDGNKELQITLGFYGNYNKFNIPAPTHQMALKWIRENFKVYIDITCSFDFKEINIIFKYISFNDKMNIIAKSDYQFLTYEEAVENSIIHTLMNLNI